MSEAHTPGPWHMQMTDHRRIRSADGNEAVCWVYRSSKFRPYYVVQADARLIAAAPDLLAACKRIEAWFDGCIGRGELRPNVELDAIRAAIAKAGGAA